VQYKPVDEDVMTGTPKERLIGLLREHSYREGDFVLASGRPSRFYVDVRRTALRGDGARLIGALIIDAIVAQGWDPRAVGGLTLGADPLATAAALAADERGLEIDSFIVRKEPKGHGTGRQIEWAGGIPAGASVVVLDDSMTTGGSTLKAVEVLRADGFHVLGAVCVVDRQEGALETLTEAGVPLVAIVGLDELRAD
jgi:orotate phosphoribosyltransferase